MIKNMENIIEKFKINVAFFAKMKEEFVKKNGRRIKTNIC
jgi:hypothetical protein